MSQVEELLLTARPGLDKPLIENRGGCSLTHLPFYGTCTESTVAS